MVLSRGLRTLGAVVAVIVAVAAGIGWLYLMHDDGLFGFGPRLHEALPLERLAHHDAQPLLRLVIAWVPAGFCCGLALGAVTRLRTLTRGLVTGIGGFAVIVFSAAASDAVTESQKVSQHLSIQPHHLSTWAAAGFLALGAVIAPSWRWRRPSRPEWGAAATLPGAGAHAEA